MKMEMKMKNNKKFVLNREYQAALEAITARLSAAITDKNALHDTLVQVEETLVKAQFLRIPPLKLYGSAGIEGFCQTIIDEHRQTSYYPTSPYRYDGNSLPIAQASGPRRAPLIIALISGGVALLLVAALVLWYIGFFAFLSGDADYFLEELDHFESSDVILEDTAPSISLTLKAGRMNHVLYEKDGHVLTVDRIGYDTYTSDGDDSQLHYWWIKVSGTVDSGFTSVSYVVLPADAQATLSDSAFTPVYANDDTYDSTDKVDGNTVSQKYYLFALPPEADGTTVTVNLPALQLTEWSRIGVGILP